MCKKPLPPGCDCDPYDPNPDSFCQGGQVCKVQFKITFKFIYFFIEMSAIGGCRGVFKPPWQN